MSELVAATYEAAQDPRAWPGVLSRLLPVVDATAAVLVDRDRVRAENSLDCRVGADAQNCLQGLALEQPAQPVGTPFALTGVWSAALQRRCGGNEEPAPALDAIGIVLERTAVVLASLYVLGLPAPAQRPAGRVLQRLAPHLRQALQIGRRLAWSEATAALLGQGLDRLEIGAIVVDTAGRLLHANREAWQRLSDADGVHWVEGLPQPCDPAGAAQLQALLARPTLQGAQAPDPDGVPLAVVGKGGAPLRLQLLALSRHAAPQGERDAAALLLIGKQVPDLALRERQAAERYGLTPAEARVVHALLDGCTIERGAQLLGVRPATVKTHLQHVFDKTAARRQVDLIKLIAEAAPPSAHRFW